MAWLSRLVSLIDKPSDLGLRLAALLVVPMVLALVYEVVSRYFFNAPTIWAQDMSIFLFGYISVLAGAGVMRERAHINVDLFYARFSARGKAVADTISYPLGLCFLGLVAWYMTHEGFLAIEQGRRRSSEWSPPVGHFYLAAALGAGLFFLQALAHWLRAAVFALTGKPLDGGCSDTAHPVLPSGS